MQVQKKPGSSARLFNERRTGERSRGQGSGLIRSISGPDTMECAVRNLSSRGAKLSVKDPSRLPPYFQLKIDSEREWRKASVRWRRGNDIGIKFER